MQQISQTANCVPKLKKNFCRNKKFPGEKQPRKNKDITLRLRKIMPVQKEGNRVNKK